MTFIKTEEIGSHQIFGSNVWSMRSENLQYSEPLNPVNKLETKETPNWSSGSLTEIKKIETSIENSIKSINDKFFRLLSSNTDLLYNVQNKIKNIPNKENQLFDICWIITWETEKYFKIRDKVFYENLLKDFLNKYIFYVNSAKQKLSDAKFSYFFSQFVQNIENAAANGEGGYVYLRLSNRLFRPIS